MASFKRIADYDKFELDAGIEGAVSHCKEHGLDFYKVLKGVDCYFEKRRRKLTDEQHAALEASNEKFARTNWDQAAIERS